MSETSSMSTAGQTADSARDDGSAHLKQQVFLLEDTVMTMSMAVMTISKAIQRWERVILPMMFGFILLAAYGFYLIFNLVYDIGMISNNVAQMTMTVDRNMIAITDELRDMKHDVRAMSKEVAQMNQGIQQLNANVAHIDYSAERMSNDLWDLSRNISGPMSTVNNVMPWQMMGGKSDSRPPARHYTQPQQLNNSQVYMPPVTSSQQQPNVQ